MRSPRLGVTFLAAAIACSGDGTKDASGRLDTAEIMDSGLVVDTGETPDAYAEVPQNEASWPTESTAVSANIAERLLEAVPDAEISGIVWDARKKVFYAVNDNGGVAMLSEYGALLEYWPILSDAEGVTVDEAGNVFVLNETERIDGEVIIPAESILSFDPEDGSYEVACSLEGISEDGEDSEGGIPGEGNDSVEAITHVPARIANHYWNISDPNGVYIVGSQMVEEDEIPRLYVYRASDCQGGEIITYATTIELDAPVSDGMVDIAGLDFNYSGNETDPVNIGTASLYVLIDDPQDGSGESGPGLLQVYSLDGEKYHEHTLPEISGKGDQEEGLVVKNVDCGTGYEDFGSGQAELVISEDSPGGGVFMWTDFPVTCQPEDLIVEA